MKVLADTSVWVEYFRRIPATFERLDGLLEENSVVLCGPVMAELVRGTHEDDRSALWVSVGALPWVETDHTTWREAGAVGYALARSGAAVPLTDVVIAVCSVRAGASLWTRDRDFARVQAVLDGLELYAP